MVFTDIRLQNFRSYTDSSFELSDSVTIVVGPNGAGKTNLLEAIMLCATNKTYKTPRLIKNDGLWARLDVHTSENHERTVKLRRENRDAQTTKSIEVDGKSYTRLPLHKSQPVVLFEPNNLFILQGDPSARRDYIDNLLEQSLSGYGVLRANYIRSLRQRNALLKTFGGEKNIFVWDVRLVEQATKIVEYRTTLIQQINQSLPDTYSKIAGKNTDVTANYKTKINAENYATNLMKSLQDSIDIDKQRGFTGYGPHRDDIIISVNGSPVNDVSSRGEIRTVLLALKIMELELLQKTREVQPTLLLDDVFSELDGSRRKALTEFLKSFQTIITTTDADIVGKNFSQSSQIIPLV